jgi:GntR family transcriptional regulator
MQLRLDLQSRVPIYTQIVEQVESLVAAGILAPGDQLPTVREVAADLRINFNTVARAYRLLHEARVISTQQGRGTYVLEPKPPGGLAGPREARLAGLVAGWLEEAERLHYRPDEVEAAWHAAFETWLQPENQDGTDDAPASTAANGRTKEEI